MNWSHYRVQVADEILPDLFLFKKVGYRLNEGVTNLNIEWSCEQTITWNNESQGQLRSIVKSFVFLGINEVYEGKCVITWACKLNVDESLPFAFFKEFKLSDVIDK